MKNEYHTIGLMSGTSLDGLDIAYCHFSYENGIWSYKIIEATTQDYNPHWKKRLTEAHLLGGRDLAQLHSELGHLHGKWIEQFTTEKNLKIDFIASHGHTVFHQPSYSFSTQIGSAPHIVAITGLPVIADFRTTDIALGGQGAPLVPIGDLHLFPEYELCLNLGGVANVSIQKDKQIHAFDICICNMALNHLAAVEGQEYDRGGMMAASGMIIEPLYVQLNNLSYFKEKKPKSLGKEFFVKEILPLLNPAEYLAQDLACTFVEHIAFQIAQTTMKGGRMLVTGGGVFNEYLIERIKALSKSKIIIPDTLTVQFKEALIFAFLGVLRMRGEVNCLASVTGASHDSIGGAIYLP